MTNGSNRLNTSGLQPAGRTGAAGTARRLPLAAIAGALALAGLSAGIGGAGAAPLRAPPAVSGDAAFGDAASRGLGAAPTVETVSHRRWRHVHRFHGGRRHGGAVIIVPSPGFYGGYYGGGYYGYRDHYGYGYGYHPSFRKRESGESKRSNGD